MKNIEIHQEPSETHISVTKGGDLDLLMNGDGRLSDEDYSSLPADFHENRKGQINALLRMSDESLTPEERAHAKSERIKYAMRNILAIDAPDKIDRIQFVPLEEKPLEVVDNELAQNHDTLVSH